MRTLADDAARETARLAALAGLEFLGGGSLADTLLLITEAATELLPASRGASVLLWDAQSETFTTSASTLGDPHGPSTASRARKRGGASRHIVDTQQPFIVPDVDEALIEPNAMIRDEAIRAYAGVPIVAEGQAVGVLYALDGEPRDYLASDVAFLEILAQRAAAAIINARLVEKLRTARLRAEAINDITQALIRAKGLPEVLRTVAEGAAAAADADWALLITVDLGKGVVVDFITGGAAEAVRPDSYDEFMAGLTGWTLRSGETALSLKDEPDLRESNTARQRRRERGVGSVIVTPLVFEGRPLGTLTVMRTAERPDFGADEVELVEGMASQATVAIENARLNEATRSALAEVQTLFDLNRRLSGAASIDELLQSVVDQVAQKLPADRVTLFGLDIDNRQILHAHRGGPGADKVFIDVGYDELLQGLSGWALRYGRPALSPKGIHDDRESDKVQLRRQETGAGSIVVVPLRYRNAIIGTITAINRVDERDFDDGDVALLSAMGSQAAVALTDARLLEEVQRLAVTDALTGLLNRGHLFDLGTQEFNAAYRYQRPLAAIMIDVDHFKQINDTRGHGVGDQVLRLIVDRCREELREVDVFGRYGGEEFAVILPETSLDNTRRVAERLRSLVEREPIPTSDGLVSATISVGVAHIEQGVSSLQELLDRADSALLVAKGSGRNQVRG